jgi:hypothetical protein
MSTTTIDIKKYVYKIVDNILYLWELTSTGYDKPQTSVTSGLKVEYSSAAKCFVTSGGVADDTSPSEASVINAKESVCMAIVDYIKANLNEDPKMYEYYMTRVRSKYARARNAITNFVPIMVTHSPYAIK